MRMKAKIFAGVLLVLFIGHLADSSLFPHTHLVDGRIVAHSHPYAGNQSAPQHEHSLSQLVLITLMGTAILAAAGLLFAIILEARNAGLYVSLREDFRERYGSLHNNLRGPPAL